MSSSSSRKMNKDEQVAQPEVHQPKWLQDFLGKKFFRACSAHSDRRNELNIYCINCKESACQYGLSSGFHHDHRILKIYKYMHRDVVCQTAMQTYINCSKIKQYKCNNRQVLHRLPRCGSTLDDTSSCSFGSRNSNGANSYQYCSIACKYKDMSRKSEDSIPTRESQGETSEPQKRKRKGTPHRAPFF
ncbi:PLATZ transcription factor family protein, putative [Medicago truncatula]|uniref:PLATZ transcription factor family protein, putative n=1 Tax=Medicago truncatula TaxID=3880 RepID=G7KG15_MEDTR|nr:PLATZ transcription factor family protein, putative [Medicago truncatula]